MDETQCQRKCLYFYTGTPFDYRAMVATQDGLFSSSKIVFVVLMMCTVISGLNGSAKHKENANSLMDMKTRRRNMLLNVDYFSSFVSAFRSDITTG